MRPHCWLWNWRTLQHERRGAGGSLSTSRGRQNRGAGTMVRAGDKDVSKTVHHVWLV